MNTENNPSKTKSHAPLAGVSVSVLSDYDILECPHCDEPTKPTRINKDESVSYKCKGCDETFKIDVDGDLVE